MRYLSVCSGIEAATVAWHPLGWEAAAFSEIEAFPRAVLAHHYPKTPCHGDFTTIGADEYGAIDLLVGGTPCQSFSVAGLRGGMADARGNLALEFLKLADRARPRWLVWENVPGVLSSNDGRDFGSFLGGLVELGYGFAYRVLDAQHFGVPQRRRRVFVVGHLGDWRRAAAVLFERHSLSGHPAPRRDTREGDAGPVARSLAVRGREGTPQAELGDDKANAILTPNGGSPTGGGRPLPAVAFGWQASPSQSMNPAEVAPALDKSKTPAVAFAQNQRDELRTMDVAGALAAEPGMKQQTYIALQSVNCPRQRKQNGIGISEADAMYSLTGRDLHGVQSGSAVRRLTPRECERLQGFPDDYTAVPYRGKPAADGPRYKALGNSMAVPVMRWIGRRIQMVEEIDDQARAAA